MKGILNTVNKPPKKHHLIPKFYLDGFALNGKIQVQQLDQKSYTSSTSKAFAVNDFYKTEEFTSGSTLEFEYHLGSIEGVSADALRKLESQKRLLTKERADVAKFILAQWVRGEDFRLASNSFNNLAIRDMARQSPETEMRLFHELSFARLLSDEEWTPIWKKYLCDEGPGFANTVANNFSQLQSLTEPSKVALLLIRKWTVVHFQQPMLISGDRPVVLDGLRRTSNGIVSPGLANSEKILFPISRKAALIMELVTTKENVEEMIGRLSIIYQVKGNKRLGEEMNKLIALNSRQKIFGHPADAGRLWILSLRLDPIRNWASLNDWSDATRRLREIKDFVWNHFKDSSREELAELIARHQANDNNTEFLFKEP